jgi:hypothetical protein
MMKHAVDQQNCVVAPRRRFHIAAPSRLKPIATVQGAPVFDRDGWTGKDRKCSSPRR